MLQWAHLTAGILSVLILSSLLIFFLRRWCCLRRPESPTSLEAASPIRNDNFQARLSKLHQTSLVHQLDTSNIKRRGSIINHQSKPGLFAWSDHPALVTDVVENGWTRFGFGTEDPHVVITWEISNGSVDFKQTIKFNQTLNAKNPLMILRGALPHPGPQFASFAFPQEAYFEITILEMTREFGRGGGDVEGEKTKLFKSDGLKIVKSREEGVLSLGLATVGSVHTRLPGQFPASIGFQSDGSVYLDGMQLVCESEKHEWAKEKKVVGCGYDPSKKKVYFTINSHLAHVINCKADEFGTPLYPILASNIETSILINFGQSPFSYIPANAQRAPNPCLAGSGLHLSAGGLGDSKELFSIGRINSQYLSNFFTNRGNNDEVASGGNSHRRKLDYDEESDADLFEIALERSARINPPPRF